MRCKQLFKCFYYIASLFYPEYSYYSFESLMSLPVENVEALISLNDWDVTFENLVDDGDLMSDFEEFDSNNQNEVEDSNLNEEKQNISTTTDSPPIEVIAVKRKAVDHDLAEGVELFYSENEKILSFARFVETAINSHDLAVITDTISKCCCKDVAFIVHYPRENPHGYSFKRMRGVAIAADYLYNYFESIPDSLFFIHDTKLNTDMHGNCLVKSKYTLNGTRLHTLVAEQQGCRLPDAPATLRLYSDIKLICSKSTAEAREYNTKGSIVFKKEIEIVPQTIHKFDRYKEKVLTMGTHVEYSGFSESSMKSRKKKRSYLNKQAEHSVSVQNNIRINTNMDRTNVDTQRVSPIVTELSSNYPDCEGFNYGDARTTKFSLSPLFSMPVPLDAHGVMKLHIGRESKVCLMEIMLYVKPL